MDRIKVLIADDHTLVRRGLWEILDKEETIELVGEASDGDEAVEKAKALEPDLVLMDIQMPRLSGLEATRQLRSQMPGIRILILTVSEAGKDLFSAIKAGARGYILKNEEPELLVHAIEYVAHGGIMISPSMANILIEELQTEQSSAVAQQEPSLAPIEWEILRLLAKGASDKAIAVRLATTEGLVQTYLNNALHKLGLANKRQAVAYAKRMGLTLTDKYVDRQGLASGTSERSTEGKGALESKVTAGQDPEEANETLEIGRGRTGVVQDEVEGDVELVISPPVEPNRLLRLLRWLKGIGSSVLGEVSGSWVGDTVLNVTLREPVPLLQLLAESPVVAEVKEEPLTQSLREETGTPRIGVQRPLPKRFRVVLKTQ